MAQGIKEESIAVLGHSKHLKRSRWAKFRDTTGSEAPLESISLKLAVELYKNGRSWKNDGQRTTF